MTEPTTTRRRVPVLFKVTAALLSLIVMLLLAEGVLRIKNASMQNYDIEMWRYARELKRPSENPDLGHEHIPNAEAELQSVVIRTNSYGLRGAPIEPLPEGGRRILFLGSSITLGWGVAEEETVTARLQKSLSHESPRPVQVLNAGIGNYNGPRCVDRFLTRLTELKPTDIVLHAFVRDAEPIEKPRTNWFLQHSQLAVTLWIATQRELASQGSNGLVEHYRKFYVPESPAWNELDLAYGRLAAYAEENHIRVYVAMTPDVHNLTDYPLGFVHAAMERLAKKYDFSYLDLRPAFDGLTPKEVWAMPGDPHPNAHGHALMAEALTPFLALPPD